MLCRLYLRYINQSRWFTAQCCRDLGNVLVVLSPAGPRPHTALPEGIVFEEEEKEEVEHTNHAHENTQISKHQRKQVISKPNERTLSQHRASKQHQTHPTLKMATRLSRPLKTTINIQHPKISIKGKCKHARRAPSKAASASATFLGMEPLRSQGEKSGGAWGWRKGESLRWVLGSGEEGGTAACLPYAVMF